jgi:hypothetical protein
MKKRAYQTCDLMHGNICVSEPCICKGMHMSAMRAKKELQKKCTHENEKLHQGDGFVYVTCADCGKDL